MIPIFLSTPNSLSPTQQAIKSEIVSLLVSEGLQPRTVGDTDFPVETPLKEAAIIAKASYGGVILGFEQGWTQLLVSKRGTKNERQIEDKRLPTPWNHVEAGMLYALRKPILVFRQEGVDGGVFDPGVSEAFVVTLPSGELGDAEKRALRSSIKTWAPMVINTFRQWN